jgi:copper chaperone CopZ
MERLVPELNGMGCGGCITNVKSALEAVTGVSVDDVTIGTAEIRYEPQRTSRRAVAVRREPR